MAWSDAARQAAALARRKGKAPRISAATRKAMLSAEMRNPSTALVGRPRAGMVEAAHGVYQARGDYARNLRQSLKKAKASGQFASIKDRNVAARVYAGINVRAALQRRR